MMVGYSNNAFFPPYMDLNSMFYTSLLYFIKDLSTAHGMQAKHCIYPIHTHTRESTAGQYKAITMLITNNLLNEVRVCFNMAHLGGE